MTRLDTISLTTSTDFIQDMKYSKFTHSKVTKPNGKIRNNHILESNEIGINKVVVNEANGTVRINISSKILGSNYPQGICLNTMEQVHETINETGLVLLPEFINNSLLNSIDIKSDLKLRYSPDNYIQSLNNLIAPKFTKAKYPSGITFNENIQRNPIRLTGYDKGYETQKNRKFYKQYPELLNLLRDILRIESRLSQKGQLRTSGYIPNTYNATIKKGVLFVECTYHYYHGDNPRDGKVYYEITLNRLFEINEQNLR